MVKFGMKKGFFSSTITNPLGEIVSVIKTFGCEIENIIDEQKRLIIEISDYSILQNKKGIEKVDNPISVANAVEFLCLQNGITPFWSEKNIYELLVKKVKQRRNRLSEVNEYITQNGSSEPLNLEWVNLRQETASLNNMLKTLYKNKDWE